MPAWTHLLNLSIDPYMRAAASGMMMDQIPRAQLPGMAGNASQLGTNFPAPQQPTRPDLPLPSAYNVSMASNPSPWLGGPMGWLASSASEYIPQLIADKIEGLPYDPGSLGRPTIEDIPTRPVPMPGQAGPGPRPVQGVPADNAHPSPGFGDVGQLPAGGAHDVAPIQGGWESPPRIQFGPGGDPYISGDYAPPGYWGTPIPEDVDMFELAKVSADLHNSVDPTTQAQRDEAGRQEPDYFGGYLDEYGERTQAMVDALKEANRRSMFFNIGAAMLGNIGNPGDAAAQSMQALGQWSTGKAGIEGLRAERDQGLIDQSLKLAQMQKYVADADKDSRSWSEKRLDLQMDHIVGQLESGEITPEQAKILAEQSIGFDYEVGDLAGMPVLVGPDGTHYMNGVALDPEEIQRIRMLEDPTREAVKAEIKLSQAEKIAQSKHDWAIRNGASPHTANFISNPSREDLFNMLYPGWKHPGFRDSLEDMGASVEEARAWIIGQIRAQGGDAEVIAKAEGATDEQILAIYEELNK